MNGWLRPSLCLVKKKKSSAHSSGYVSAYPQHKTGDTLQKPSVNSLALFMYGL